VKKIFDFGQLTSLRF